MTMKHNTLFLCELNNRIRIHAKFAVLLANCGNKKVIQDKTAVCRKNLTIVWQFSTLLCFLFKLSDFPSSYVFVSCVYLKEKKKRQSKATFGIQKFKGVKFLSKISKLF